MLSDTEEHQRRLFDVAGVCLKAWSTTAEYYEAVKGASEGLGFQSGREGPPSIWDTHGISGNVFGRSTCIFISSFSSRIASMEFVN